MPFPARVSLGSAFLVLAAACQAATGPVFTSPVATPTGTSVEAPARAVELVIPAARDSALDLDGRTLQRVIESGRLSTQPVQPVDRDTGSAAAGYVAGKRGDMQVLLLVPNALLAAIAVDATTVHAVDFTPIANLAIEPVLLWVNADSAWRTATDLLAAAKQGALVVAGSGARREDEILVRRIQTQGSTRPFSYLAEPAPQDALTSVATHQAGAVAAVGSSRAAIGLPGSTRAKLRALCAFTSDPIGAGAWSGLATCTSQGLPIADGSVLRAVMAPPGLSAPQQAYWIDAMRRVADDPDWKQYLADNELRADLRTGADLRRLVETYERTYRDTAAANGWTK